jgi:DNA repair protein RadC
MKPTILRETGILSWHEEERPREKLIQRGKTALSDAELIGILLGSGTRSLSAVDLARQLLKAADYDLQRLARMSVEELMDFKGIGEAKAINIISALELGRRRKERDPVKREKITCSEDIYRLMRPHLQDEVREEFWIVMLNRANLVMKKYPVSQGGVSGTVADPKLIFKAALQLPASAIILVHNHPSGNLKPSTADIQLTQKLKQAGNMLDLPVLDHVIYTDQHYFSFADEGIL